MRPTESLTVFTQQIGRGLRIADGKSHCVIIDLIGNYRNANLKMRVFTEDGQLPPSITSTTLDLPPTCAIQLDLAVINLLDEMQRKRSPRKQQLVEAFFELKTDLGYRPTYLEYHLKARADSRAVKQEFGSYIGLLAYAKELNDVELDTFDTYRQWIQEVNGTRMTKSYKMIVLQYMLSRGSANWLDAITAEEAAPYFYRYLTEKEYRMRTDLADKQSKGLRSYDEGRMATLIAKMPMEKWSASSKGLISYENGVFSIHVEASREQGEILYGWMEEVCAYRLHVYFERKGLRIG